MMKFLPSVKAKKHEERVRARMCEIKKKVLRSLASADMRARSCFFCEFPKRKNKLPRKYYRDCYVFHISHKRLPTAFVIKYQQTILCNKNAHTTVCSFFRCLKKTFCFCYYCYFFSLRLYNIPTPFLFSPANGPLQKYTQFTI